MRLFSKRKPSNSPTKFNPNVDVSYDSDFDTLHKVVERHISIGSQTVKEHEFALNKGEKVRVAMRGDKFVYAYSTTVKIELPRIITMIDPRTALHRELRIINRILEDSRHIPTLDVLIQVAKNTEVSVASRQAFFALVAQYAINVYNRYHESLVPIYSETSIPSDTANTVVGLIGVSHTLQHAEHIAKADRAEEIRLAIENASGETGDKSTKMELHNDALHNEYGADLITVVKRLIVDSAANGFSLGYVADESDDLSLPRDVVWNKLRELVRAGDVSFVGVEQEETLPELSFDVDTEDSTTDVDAEEDTQEAETMENTNTERAEDTEPAQQDSEDNTEVSEQGVEDTQDAQDNSTPESDTPVVPESDTPAVEEEPVTDVDDLVPGQDAEEDPDPVQETQAEESTVENTHGTTDSSTGFEVYDEGFDEDEQDTIEMLFSVDEQDDLDSVNGGDELTLVQRVEELYADRSKEEDTYYILLEKAEVVDDMERRLSALQSRITASIEKHQDRVGNFMDTGGMMVTEMDEGQLRSAREANDGFFQLSSMEERRYRINQSRRMMLTDILDMAESIDDEDFINAIHHRIEGIDGIVNEVFHSPEEDENLLVDPEIAAIPNYTTEEAPIFYKVMEEMGIDESLIR